ncbi:uncharacterized protein LOC105189370 isoform X2 [Harpegnathos saltator]|uniref:uncharacterized protein LOC105189370 isoform X1 n=1 Tax=Harpegnathos saltator TaxID=610380 RepID=UPI0005912641|nr:uncharacterized protein LOC105189370 isoform X1 [Harpegnathos saltator]XP_019699846.1 uncharacterized protein LOC105189370 isoform X2 [Harpegnathos saltator]
MKVYLILGLLVTAACAEKKINLEDIERDNLRAENKAKAENIQTDETKYSVKPNVNQQQYQIPSQYNTLGGHPDGGSYISSQQLEDIKYSQVPPEQYIQPNQYAVHEAQYQQQSQSLPQYQQQYQQSPILTQQNIPLLQYNYNGYQQQVEVPTKGAAPNAFEAQKLNYQPEVVVGNHIQSVQQKAVTDKYTKTSNKGPVYFDVPATQLLSYYPYLNINSAVSTKGVVQPSLHQLPNNAVPQISLPVYTPVYNQKPLASSVKTPYPYPTIVPTTFTSKTTKGSAYTFPVTLKKVNPPSLPALSLYVQPQQPLAQGKKLLYTQAYVTPSQPQYVQQLIYTQPGVVYSDPTAAYSDLYARIPAYIQENSLRGQVNQYETQQQVYVTPTIGHEAPKEVLQEQVGQELPQDYIKVPDEPKTHFIPPQLPAQDFKSSITQLEPVSYEDEESLQVKDHSLPSEPKTLLDTYIPSRIIASQDSTRYVERPIKLEGGFLPSKTNFALKKRKSE